MCNRWLLSARPPLPIEGMGPGRVFSGEQIMPRDEKTLRKLTQPADWWEAFERAAAEAGMSLSEWAGDRMKRGLAEEARASLSQRRGRGNPHTASQR
jgi:hypothetical protein